MVRTIFGHFDLPWTMLIIRTLSVTLFFVSACLYLIRAFRAESGLTTNSLEVDAQ